MGFHPDDYDKTPPASEYAFSLDDAESTKMFIEIDYPELADVKQGIDDLEALDRRSPRAQFELDCLKAIWEAETDDG